MTAQQTSLAVVQETTKREALRQDVRAQLDRHKITQAALSKETGLSRSVISQWLAGQYDHDGDADLALQAWLRKRRRGGGGDLIELKNTRYIWDVCDHAVAGGELVVIVGKPGLGKTVALQAWHDLRGGEVSVQVVSPLVTPTGLVRGLALRFELPSSGAGDKVLQEVVTYLRRKPKPLVFDEANNLSVRCLEVVRHIFDQTSTPIVLCGSMALQQRLSVKSSVHTELDQLQSRVERYCLLAPLGLEEVRRVVLGHLEESELGDQPQELIKLYSDQSAGVTRVLVKALRTSRKLLDLNPKLRGVLTERVVTEAFRLHRPKVK